MNGSAGECADWDINGPRASRPRSSTTSIPSTFLLGGLFHRVSMSRRWVQTLLKEEEEDTYRNSSVFACEDPVAVNEQPGAY